MNLLHDVLLISAALLLTEGVMWNPTFPNGKHLEVCVGDTVIFNWTITADGNEFITNSRWDRNLTYDKSDHVSLPFGNKQTITDHSRLTYGPRAQLVINNAHENDTGYYHYTASVVFPGQTKTSSVTTEASLVVQVPPVTKDDSLTVVWTREAHLDKGVWSMTLLCGKFISRGQPPIEVVWTTPEKIHVRSTFYNSSSGHFHLVLPSTFAGGEYSCYIPDRSIARRCAPPNRSLSWESSVLVDETVGRQVMLDARLREIEIEMHRGFNTLTRLLTTKGLRHLARRH